MARVSTQTVSRVINERPEVSRKTRSKVKKVIEKLGYRPSAIARSLTRRRTHTIGVATAGLKYIGPSRTLNGIVEAAEEAGYTILLKELPHFDSDNNELILDALISQHVDGIIWAVQEVGKNRMWMKNFSLNFNIPIVHLTMEPRKNLSVVSINDYEGVRMAMAHLLEQGYRHIGHISGPLAWWEARRRMQAWKDILEFEGFKLKENYWVEGNWSSSSGAGSAEKLFEQYPELDSIFVANDQMALGAMRVVHKKGLRIPEDIGIVGFDNIPESAFFWPSLTTVNQDQNNLGKTALKEIVKIIEASWNESIPLDPKSILLEPTLVVRDSSVRISV